MDEYLEAARAHLAQVDLERLQRCLSGVRGVAHRIAYNQRLAELEQAIREAEKQRQAVRVEMGPTS